MVSVARFELAISCSQSKRINQTFLHRVWQRYKDSNPDLQFWRLSCSTVNTIPLLFYCTKFLQFVKTYLLVHFIIKSICLFNKISCFFLSHFPKHPIIISFWFFVFHFKISNPGVTWVTLSYMYCSLMCYVLRMGCLWLSP